MGDSKFWLRSVGRTDIGRRRSRNEDSFLCDDELGLWLVADGMGGHAGGEVASQSTAEAIFCEVKRAKDQLAGAEASSERLMRLLESAVQAAAYQVYGLAEFDLSKMGMGTTVSALMLHGRRLVTAQVGDSRIYLSRNGCVELLTEDHTLVNWRLKRGLITPEQAEASRDHNVITRAVGHRDHVEVDTATLPVVANDRYMLCSDGLHGYLTAPELPAVLEGDRERVADCLVKLANQRGGKDNITAIVVDVC